MKKQAETEPNDMAEPPGIASGAVPAEAASRSIKAPANKKESLSAMQREHEIIAALEKDLADSRARLDLLISAHNRIFKHEPD